MKSEFPVGCGRERVLAHFEGKPVDRLALMPITMMLAADQIGVKYHNYATDYRVLVEARAKMGPQPFLLDNLDPVRVLRNGTPDMIRAALAECHRQGGPRYIIGAGCEVPRDTPPSNTRALLEYAKTATS